MGHILNIVHKADADISTGTSKKIEYGKKVFL